MFFLPIGDTPNAQHFRPWLTWALLAANVLVYALIAIPMDEAGTYGALILERGFTPATPEALDLLTSMFLHAGLAHLGGNLLFLWIFGDNVEHAFGRFWFLVTYVGTGVVATLTFAAFSWGSEVPLVGASGAISGLLGVYFVLFGQNRVKVFLLAFPFYVGTVLVPSRWVLGIYVVIDNLLPFLSGVGSNVAYGAHLGGFFAGVVVALVGNAFGWGLGDEQLEDPGEEQLRLGQAWLERGQHARAWQHLARAAELTDDPSVRRRAIEAMRQVQAHRRLLERYGVSKTGSDR